MSPPPVSPPPAACHLCGAEAFQSIHRNGPWQYLRCRRCGLVALFPRPRQAALLSVYDDYLPAAPERIVQWRRMVQPVIERSAAVIAAHARKSPGALLDIGCGFGFFLEHMRRRGWQVEGLEVSPVGRAYARQEGGLTIHARPLEHLDLPENRFDVVTLFYVIEHIGDPLALLHAVRRVLKPGGLVLLRWPHTTPIVRLLGPLARFGDLYHTPYHLFDFNPQTIRGFLERAGFSGIRTLIGGHTHPSNPLARGCSIATGHLAEVLYRLSAGRCLLPGVSKTTLALA